MADIAVVANARDCPIVNIPMKGEHPLNGWVSMVCSFSGPELIRDGLTESRKVCCGLTSPHFKLFLEIMDIVFPRINWKRTIQIVTNLLASFINLHM